MDQWEYCDMQRGMVQDHTAWMEVMNRLGADGWEFVYATEYWFYFKRKIKAPEVAPEPSGKRVFDLT